MAERIELEADAPGQRVDRFLAEHTQLSRSAIQRLARDGRVTVNGAAVEPAYKVHAGEALVVDVPDAEPALSLLGEDIPIDVLYEDDDVLVVNKPAGLVVHPAHGHATGTLVNAVVGKISADTGRAAGRPGIVHRLDRDTSGLLVVARTQETYEGLQRLVRRRELTREYLALIAGRPRSRRGTIEAPVGRDRRDRLRHSLDTATPRAAVTHFEVEELLPKHALLRVRLETGRTHQIRVHLEAIDLPVAGDPVYGVPGDLGLQRQFLHAARLAFTHPVTGEPVDVHSPLPADLTAALERATVEG